MQAHLVFGLFSLLGVGALAHAQAGDQPFDDLEVLVLPAEQPEGRKVPLHWGCDALVISDAARYRREDCRQPEATEEVTELTLEPAEKSSNPSARTLNKLTY